MYSQMWVLPPNQSKAHSSEKSFSPAKWEGSLFGAKFRLHPQGKGSSSSGLPTEQAAGSVSQWPQPAPESSQQESEMFLAQQCGSCCPWD